ncbi:hypothetical protein E3P92_01847 [Wallemia ichthyophaga]|uniref:4a-hydroxytetrahydrobiopterin dehydratase n=2 Tax=Wallemia ichthyophaga TaxID=245174 RepID=A0A4T0EFJ5_WALIC|nr:Putative pterin-4-alpha-carbinolamine dehydratase [Wallemia ichthyophaga EXF-994]TIA73051.1 hypothetical protein E3P91_01670 [Wallemia ichthyophaga]EOR01050.1 Putative pterin-4-alpha-carbinolamine dehydratase [Wallemia ichthyophaga EXF-994]TIA83906.1 hypothetical protein E3P98_00506 [Wallemia ichthyophaga]TIA94152.1 hypothetical protein E3P97_00436 [Wallemia ichthyophaga]TIB01138.1 hypothetical protein E3P95_01404 [Wallemia ichthyophaga]
MAEIIPKLENYKQRDNSIERLYTFKGFRGAVKFINAVADECVKHNHHPTITNMYGHVRLNWLTHSTAQAVPGITSKDIELAWECNKAYQTAFGARPYNDRERELEGM